MFHHPIPADRRDAALRLLARAHDLLASSPAAWTTGAFARNRDGISVPYSADAACSFCAEGALNRSHYDVTGRPYGFGSPAYDLAWQALTSAVRRRTGGELEFIVEFNDRHATSAADVLAVFDEAAQLLQDAPVSGLPPAPEGPKELVA